jgi:multidrug resistance efflux pump
MNTPADMDIVWREQCLAHERKIARLEKKVASVNTIRSMQEAELAQLRRDVARYRCLFELMSTAKRYADGGTADDMQAEVAEAIHTLRLQESGA